VPKWLESKQEKEGSERGRETPFVSPQAIRVRPNVNLNPAERIKVEGSQRTGNAGARQA
jgi:hypothetical protein